MHLMKKQKIDMNERPKNLVLCINFKYSKLLLFTNEPCVQYSCLMTQFTSRLYFAGPADASRLSW